MKFLPKTRRNIIPIFLRISHSVNVCLVFIDKEFHFSSIAVAWGKIAPKFSSSLSLKSTSSAYSVSSGRPAIVIGGTGVVYNIAPLYHLKVRDHLPNFFIWSCHIIIYNLSAGWCSGNKMASQAEDPGSNPVGG